MDEKKNSWHSIIINRQAISKLQYKYARKSIQSYTVHGGSPLELILNFLFDENYIMREINAIITTARHISHWSSLSLSENYTTGEKLKFTQVIYRDCVKLSKKATVK